MHTDGHQTFETRSGEAALDSARLSVPDIAIIDLKLPGMDGVQTFRALGHEHPRLKGIMLTAFGTIPSAVTAMQAGFSDYLEKPVDFDELRRLVRTCCAVPALSAGALHEPTVPALRREDEFEGMVGACPSMTEIFRLIPAIAATSQPVLVTGETGTGKELVAKALHRHSPRRHGPFIDINCAAGQVTLFETEFFGHERGAFTDAQSAKPGRFELANGGTLFLDEVGELPLEAQAKLLRVLERGEVVRIGGTRPVRFDVRIVAATNADLQEAVRRGAFRRDLFHRLNVLTVQLPALRQRQNDLALLVARIFDRTRREFRKDALVLSEDAKLRLIAHDWPGNIRELQHVLLRAVVGARQATVRAADLQILARSQPMGVQDRDFLLPAGFDLAQHLADVTTRIEQSLLRQALQKAGGNRAEAARLLGIDRRTVFRKLQEAEPPPDW
jgi:DNA-binding NtrC family response regulator